MEDCSICCDKIINIQDLTNIIKTSCSHIYHKECLYTWLYNNSSCPLCRSFIEKIPKPINQEDLDKLNKIYSVLYKYTPNKFIGKLVEISYLDDSSENIIRYKFTNISNSLWPMPLETYVYSNQVHIILSQQ